MSLFFRRVTAAPSECLIVMKTPEDLDFLSRALGDVCLGELRALSGLFKDARLSVYSETSGQGMVGSASHLVSLLLDRLQDACEKPS